jgi:hypothetical protein
MADIQSYSFNFKEVAEALVKHQGLHEGIWQLAFEFGFSAINAGPNVNDLRPAIINTMVKVLLTKVEQETNLAVDAAKVNPPEKKTPEA